MSWQPPHTPVTISLPAPSGKFCPGCWAAEENTEPSRAAATRGNSDLDDIESLRKGCVQKPSYYIGCDTGIASSGVLAQDSRTNRRARDGEPIWGLERAARYAQASRTP